MSYTKQTTITCGDGETVVRLDDGNYVAVKCPANCDPITNKVTFSPRARFISASGDPIASSGGQPIQSSKEIPIDALEVDRLGASAVVRECLLLVLGEPLTPDPAHPSQTLIPWSADLINQCSIRSAIAAATLTAPNASEVL